MMRRPMNDSDFESGGLHPAKFSAAILTTLAKYLAVEVERSSLADLPLKVLDPFAGSGKIHLLGNSHIETWGVEIEPEWAALHERTICGDSRYLSRHVYDMAPFDVVATSPVYPNGICDSFETTDPDRQDSTYRSRLGRRPSPANACEMVRGRRLTREYCLLHSTVWANCLELLKPGGLILLNTSNHFLTPRKGEEPIEVRTNEWHLGWFLARGCMMHCVERVSTPRYGFGANASVRVGAELVSVLRAPTTRGML